MDINKSMEEVVMKKMLILISIIISIFMITGCVNTDISLDIDKKGNMKIIGQLISSDYLMNGIDENELKNSFDNVEKISEPGKTGYKITEDLGNIKDLNLSKDNKLKDYKDLVDVNIDDRFIYDIYDVNIYLKDYMQKGMTSEEIGIINIFGSGLNLDLHLNTPISLEESNASSSSKNAGINTYNWDLSLGNLDNIHIKFKVPNIQNIVILIIGVALIMVLAIFILKRKRNNRV